MNRLKWLPLVLIPLVFAGAYLSFTRYWDAPFDPGAKDRKVAFELTRGMAPQAIAQALEKDGLIGNARLFYWGAKLQGGWGGIKAAEYELSAALAPKQILQVLKSGIGIQRALLVREGDNIYQVAETFEQLKLSDRKTILERLRSQNFIAELGLSGEGVVSLEGYLKPDTYFFDKRETPDHLIRRMVEAFLKLWTPEFEARARELGMSRREVVILASMVEKETGAGFERPLIASVFHNRLKKKMRLQSDPTTIYGIWETYSGNVRRSDLLHSTPFNTYTVAALPAGPIANPNPESVRAVLYPQSSEFLYFVSKNDGTHIFSKTYGEHNAHVRETQLDPKAREGKSWRDLGKEKKTGSPSG
jgi:UPF0755 protein